MQEPSTHAVRCTRKIRSASNQRAAGQSYHLLILVSELPRHDDPVQRDVGNSTKWAIT